MIENKKEQVLEKVNGTDVQDGIFVASHYITMLAPYALNRVEKMIYLSIESVSYIGEGACLNCHNLNNIFVSDKLRTIERSAFSGCTSLRNFPFSCNLKRIEKEAFACCSNLTTVKLPKKLEKIGYRAFSFCENLEEITFWDGVQIEKDIFSNCNNLKKITILVDGIKNIKTNLEALEQYKDKIVFEQK